MKEKSTLRLVVLSIALVLLAAGLMASLLHSRAVARRQKLKADSGTAVLIIRAE